MWNFDLSVLEDETILLDIGYSEVCHSEVCHSEVCHSEVCHSEVCHSEVCHPRCVFKLYGEVNSVKNTTINVWLNDGVY